MANNEFGLSYVVIAMTTDDPPTDTSTYTNFWSGYVENVEISTSVSTVELRGSALNDTTASWTPYPREVKPQSIDATVRVSLKGASASDVAKLLELSDFNGWWKLDIKTALGTTYSITGLKLTNKSGTLPGSDYTSLTLEFKQVVTA